MRAAVIAIVVGAVVAGPATAIAQSPQVLRFHGGAYDRAAAIVADGSGNSYVGGSVESRDGASSFAVVKLGPDGADALDRALRRLARRRRAARPTPSPSTPRATCTPRDTSATA